MAGPVRSIRLAGTGPRAGRITRENPLRFERRAEARAAAKGALSASYAGPDRCGITRLEIVDRSASGLGALTRTEIEPGMTVTICPEGSTIPWLRGRATRCTRDGEMFRVGIAFDRRLAA